VLEYPRSGVHTSLPDPVFRRVLAGLAMGLTAMAIIYSPWGKRSGAHMNPSVTLAFLSLGRIRGADAIFFIVAQFVGSTLGVLVVLAMLGAAFSAPPVSYAATLPGSGVAAAFIAEVMISAALMFVILLMQAAQRAAPFTGVVAGILVATYISLEAPLSGMSMNPARSFASAAPGGMWQHLWIYFAAPIVGMVAAAQLFRYTSLRAACAKLVHPEDVRCIHCGYEPPPSTRGRRPGPAVHEVLGDRKE
jgi:aquaporin Z